MTNTLRDPDLRNLNLFDVTDWPEHLRSSAHADLLGQAAELGAFLDEALPDPALDQRLHDTLRALAKLASWLKRPAGNSAPAYTTREWDLRALHSLSLPNMRMTLREDLGADGLSRFTASLFDGVNSNLVAHPSDLEHNSLLFYHSGQHGEAWSPNLALARITLAAYLLAAIERVCDDAAGRPNTRRRAIEQTPLAIS